MFSVQQKREISDAVQKILRSTMHPELPPTGEVTFSLKVLGAESWSYADIKNNGAVGDPGVNPHNELMASMPEKEARELIDAAIPYAEHLTPIMDLQQQVTAELNRLKDRLSLVEGKADGLIEKVHDPRNTPDEFIKEMLNQQIATLNKRVSRMEERDKIKDKLYAELGLRLERLEDYLKEIMEDNLIAHHSDQLRNMMTAMRQLGNPQIQKTLEGG